MLTVAADLNCTSMLYSSYSSKKEPSTIGRISRRWSAQYSSASLAATSASCWGYYSIVTSELNMSDIEIRKIYKGLSRIEETFRITKSELDTRPIHVTTNEHIESHFTTCFAAITLLRLLEISLGNKYPAPQIIESLRQFNCVNISSNIYRMTYTNEILKQCGALHDIDTGKKHRTKEEIRRILKY